MSRGCLKLVLALLLVLGQSLSLLHAADLESHEAGEVCEVCLLGQAMDDTAIDAGGGPPPALALSPRVFYHSPDNGSGPHVRFLARAPPVIPSVR